MSYYVTMKSDNVDEVVSVYLSDDISAVARHIIDIYGEVKFKMNENGTHEGRLVEDEDVVFRIVKS